MCIQEAGKDNSVYSSENRYRAFEKCSPTKYNRVSIDGSIVGCGKCVGYCQYEQHAGFLTKAQRKNHNCINKQCHYYIPKPPTEAPKREKIKEDYIALITPFMKLYEGLKVLRANESDDGSVICYYISITNAYSIENIEQKLMKELRKTVVLQRLMYDFDVCASLIFSE